MFVGRLIGPARCRSALRKYFRCTSVPFSQPCVVGRALAVAEPTRRHEWVHYKPCETTISVRGILSLGRYVNAGRVMRDNHRKPSAVTPSRNPPE